MEQASNQLSEAAEGEYGKKIAENIKERMEWVVSEVKGDRVLDIGCNQGEISIMLGRTGKKVTAVDADEEAINYAKEALQKESEEVQNNVTFKKLDILEDSIDEDGFDTVILSEVLEQYESAEALLKEASRLMKGSGKIIVTVPFGIRNYSDQKRTFYFQDIYQDVKQLYKVEEIEFIGSSVGLTGTPSMNRNRGPIPARFIQRLEAAFYRLEQRLHEKSTNQETMIRELKQEKEKLEADLLTKGKNEGLSRSEQESDSSNQRIKELSEENQSLKDQLEKFKELNQRWEKELKELHEENTQLNQRWTERFNDLRKQTEDLIARYKKQIAKLKKRKW